MSIEVKNVTKKYGQQLALNQVSFSIEKNELVGFIGPNGAGKSTMMKIITGLIGFDSGTVNVNGMDVTGNKRDIKKLIGYLPENNPLYYDMYVKEYLELMAGIHKIKKSKQRINEIVDVSGLAPERNKKIGALSKGYKQRVGIAQALLADPQVLIMDEPTTGLDPNQIIEIRNLISNIAKEKTVMLSTHIMQEVEAICKRVIIINKGEISADNNTEEISNMLGNNSETVSIEFNAPVNENELRKLDGVKNIKHLKGNEWLIETGKQTDIRPLLFNFAVSKKITVLSLQKQNKKLEEVFQILTKD